MRKVFLVLLASFAAGAAQAQIKCWNEGGKRVCGDTPPAGAKVTTIRSPSGPADPAPAAAKADAKGSAAKAAKRGPLTPAEQEQEFRKRQAEARKSAEKQAEEDKLAEAKRDNCARAQEALRSYDSGRVARTDSKGERFFLSEAEVAQETAKARQIAKDSCN